MLTPLDVYLVMQADTLVGNLSPLAEFLAVASIVLFLCGKEEDELERSWILTRLAILALCVSTFAMSILLILPSSKTLGAMYLVPQVVNSKQAQKLDALSLKILDLVDHVADKADEALKEGK